MAPWSALLSSLLLAVAVRARVTQTSDRSQPTRGRGPLGAEFFEGDEGLEASPSAVSAPGTAPGTHVTSPPSTLPDLAVEAYQQTNEGSFLRLKDGGTLSVDKEWNDFADSTATWSEQAVNTTLKCATPGCTASALLQAFDGTKMRGHSCRLSLSVHPTDFDDQYSGERLEWVRVNDVIVNQDCFPMVSGCNVSTQKTTFNCISDLALDSIINETGTLSISAQIPTVVDECPYEGNLLSAIPKVTCMVTPIESVNETVLEPKTPLPIVDPWPQFISTSAPLRCIERNCTATATLVPSADNIEDPATREVAISEVPTKRFNYTQCLLSVKVYQTDFDQDQGTSEVIEFVKVGGAIAGSNITPGNNPCRAKWNGTSLAQQDMEYNAVANFDVTQNISAQNFVEVEAKISEWVDECAYEGYLLNGFVELNCSVAPFGESVSGLVSSNVSNSNTNVVTTAAGGNATAGNSTAQRTNATASDNDNGTALAQAWAARLRGRHQRAAHRKS